MRLFVALSLPETVRDRLALLCQGLPSARWVAPENLHLTLRFIGEVDHAQADDIHDELARVDCEAFALSLAGLDTFGEGRKLRQLWAGVDSDPAQSCRSLRPSPKVSSPARESAKASQSTRANSAWMSSAWA